MSIDVLFLAKDRLEFTKASFTTLMANTDWSLVDRLVIYDDGSTDGTDTWLVEQCVSDRGALPGSLSVMRTNLGAPAAIMNDYLENFGAADMFAKVDNDVIVPPRWLNECADVMAKSPDLDLLGIEPPESRTPHHKGGPQSPRPELDPVHRRRGYAPCDSIGGVGVMRRSAFRTRGPLKPYAIYGGFTDWQLKNRDVAKGWIVPPLSVFLLDRMPTEPWASLSREYIAKGWQRAWSGYDPAVPFWSWWTHLCDHGVGVTSYCAPCGRTNNA